MSENLLENENLDSTGADDVALSVPEKFKNYKSGGINANELLKSYIELEKKLSNMIKLPFDKNNPQERTTFRKAFGIPEDANGYNIVTRHKLLESDGDVNQKLLDADFTPQQAQLVYDLAAERVIPLIEEMAAEFEADKQRQKLISHFGGEERWRETSRQISSWGQKNLPEDIYETLATTYEGIIAISRMMGAGEPDIGNRGEIASSEVSEKELKTMMKDPRYWRDKDPSYISKVSDGFKKLYGNQ
ncbi:MAG: hypothetical protein AB7U85_02120 [Alphaproteobacteria bacterium]